MEYKVEQIKELLREQYDYPSADITVTAEQLYKMSEYGRQIFRSFVETGVLPDVSFHGLSIQEMYKQRPNYSPIAIIIIYDGLVSAISKQE